MVDGGDRGQPERALREPSGAEEELGQVFDAPGIFTADLAAEVVEQWDESEVGTVAVGLAPPADVLVGVYAYEHAWPVADALDERPKTVDPHEATGRLAGDPADDNG